MKFAVSFVFILVSLSFSAVVSVQNWNANKSYSNQDIVIYEGKAYLAVQNISAGNTPNQNSSVWKHIVKYSTPGTYKHDSAYVAGDIVKYQYEAYVARHWSNYTYPNKNDAWGAWIFISNYAPLSSQPSGPLAKLPPDPGAAGKKTLLGIDSDNDGIRDDIQIAVTKLFPDDPYKRAGALFPFAMQQEFFKAVSENPNKPFEFYNTYFMGISAGVYYNIITGAEDIMPSSKRKALLYNTRERFLMCQKIDSIANGHMFQTYDDYPEYKEKYDKKFQEFYKREQERQK